MRAAARPSQSGGTREGSERRAAIRLGMSLMRPGARPSSVFVPRVHVTGRSVLSRNVKHGTPRYVLSSWTPPESVRTPAAPLEEA